MADTVYEVVVYSSKLYFISRNMYMLCNETSFFACFFNSSKRSKDEDITGSCVM